MPTASEVRDALRVLHGAAPEATAVVEAQLDSLEEQITLHTSEDAFRAFVLAQAQQAGLTQGLLQRLDTSVLGELAKAEAARADAALLEAQDREQRAMTTRQVLSQPVVLAVIGIISTVMTGLVTLVLSLVGGS
jgi:hypothetical protein